MLPEGRGIGYPPGAATPITMLAKRANLSIINSRGAFFPLRRGQPTRDPKRLDAHATFHRAIGPRHPRRDRAPASGNGNRLVYSV